MKFLDADVKKGERKFLWLEVSKLTSGAPLRIPVHVVRGEGDGKTLCLTAGVHGDETLAIDVFDEVLRRTNPKKTKGTLVVVPVINPLALEAFTRNTPIDMLDLNRNFPGSEGGWLSEQMAHALVEEVIKKVDCLVDFHASPPFMRVNYTPLSNAGGKTSDESERLALIFGQKLLYRSAGYPGSITKSAVQLGIPSFGCEFGAMGAELQEEIRVVNRGVGNLMIELGMTAGRVKRTGTQYIFYDGDYMVMRPRSGGVLRPAVVPGMQGETVDKGRLLGTIVSPYDYCELEEFRAPYGRTSLVLVRYRSIVRPGDYGYIVANFGNARKVVSHGE